MSKSVKNGKPKSKSSIDSNSVLFAMGYFDIILKIKLTDEDLLKSTENVENEQNNENNENNENEESSTPKDNDNYYHIENLNYIEDLEFLENKKEIWDKITISGGNDTLKQLLIGNRISKKKCKIEYFSFNRPLFTGKEEFYSQIFEHVCSKNNIYISDIPLESSARYSLKIILQHKLEINTIFIGTSYEDEEKERIKKKMIKQKQQDLVKEHNNEENNENNNNINNNNSDNEEENKNNNNDNKDNKDNDDSSEEDFKL